MMFKNKFKKIFLGTALSCFLFFNLAEAQIVGVTEPDNLPTDISVQEIIANIINYSAGLIGLISVLMIIIAGIMWAISQGDEEKIKKARQWILAGVVGATIALGSWAIVQVVIYGFFD